MNPFFFGIPAWLLCASIAYFLREKAIGQLSAEQIGQITLAQRPGRIKLWLAYVGILAVFLVLRFGFPGLMNLWFLLALSVFAATAVFFEVKGMQFTRVIAPVSPMRMLVSAGVVGLAGQASLLGAMATTVFLE